MANFYDTNAVLNLGEDVVKDGFFYISDVTLHELEHIKTSFNKSEEVKYQARTAIRTLDENHDGYKVVFYTPQMLSPETYDITPDLKICACANSLKDTENLVFVSDDICCRTIAREIFGLNCSSAYKPDIPYSGFSEVIFDDKQLAYFYEHLSENQFNLLINQYLIVKNKNNETIDKFKWNGEYYKTVVPKTIKSAMFGTIRPFDDFQACAIDSIYANKITMIKGKAGSGKSFLAISCLFQMLEKHKIDKIIIFCNTVATINSAKLGFYPGTKDEKLQDSQIGNILSSKLGGEYILDRLINEEKIVLLPMSDIRGYDTTGMNAGIYITEAQNFDISLMKLALQRIGEDCICIIDGDYNAQVDLAQYAGSKNGMRRISQVFKGSDLYGEVELKKIYRGRIAEMADSM